MNEPNSTVHVGSVFSFHDGVLSSAAHTGSVEVNTAILNTAIPRPRAGTGEVLSDGPSAVIAGVEQGAASATKKPSAALIAGRIAPGAAVIGGVNDAINVGQHVVQGNGAEAMTEGLGVAGQAGGAVAGAELGAWLLTPFAVVLGPAAPSIGALVGGVGGAFAGAQGAKSLGAYLTGGDTPDKLGPPLTLPNDTALTPTVTRSDGSQYALVQLEGKYTWFSIQDNPALPSRYVEVVSGARSAELTGSYLQAAGFESQLAQAQAGLAQQQRVALRDAFARSEIQSANNMGPNGLPWDTPSAIGADATQTWARSPEPAQALNILEVRNADSSVSRIVQEVDKASGVLLGDKTYENPEASNPDSFRLVATSDYQSGVHWTLNRETGFMEQAGIASGMDTTGRMILTGAAAQSVADYQMRPGASTGTDSAMSQDPALAPVAVEGASGLGTYTTVSIQTHANGAASFDFVGEDGSRAWVMHNAETGNRTVTINSGQEVAGEPRTVIYELDRDSRRVGHERYFDAAGTPVNERGEVPASPAAPALAPAPAQAPAQPEPTPEIIMHEQRVIPTLGGMSFAEAHRRRDEPEQISPGSLQPVGTLDTSHLDKGSQLHRMHRAQEQDLMRGLGIAIAQDKDRFKNEPAPGRQQPSVERTQERAQEQAPRRLLEGAPVQKQAARPAAEAMHPSIIHASVASPVHPNPQGAVFEQRATMSPPSQPMTQPAAAAIAAAQAEKAAALAELAEMQQRVARMEEQRRQEGRERRDERDQREATQGAQSRDTRQHLDAGSLGRQPANVASHTSGPSTLDRLSAFSDPSHPHNAMYSKLRELLPEGTSEKRLAQSTSACYMSGIDEKNLRGIDINGTRAVFAGDTFMKSGIAVMDISQPPPTVQQSEQQVQRYDQQQAQMMSEIRAQNAAQANQQQGHDPGLAR